MVRILRRGPEQLPTEKPRVCRTGLSPHPRTQARGWPLQILSRQTGRTGRAGRPRTVGDSYDFEGEVKNRSSHIIIVKSSTPPSVEVDTEAAAVYVRFK